MTLEELQKIALQKFPIPKTRCRTEHRLMKKLREEWVKKNMVLLKEEKTSA